MTSVEAFILLLLLPALAFLYVKRKYGYWCQRGVPYIEPQFPYGNFRVARSVGQATYSTAQYRQMKDYGPFFGLYFILEPLVMITDLDLIKTVLIKDFNYFPNRGVFHNESTDVLSGNLFMIEGKRWRELRNKLSPCFSSGKLRAMFSTVRTVSENFQAFLTENVGDGAVLNVKDYFARFTIDTIGSCGFGIECNSFKDPDSLFRYYGQRVFDFPRYSRWVSLFFRVFPGVGTLMRAKVFRDDVINFFENIVRDTVRYRESNSVKRPDFMDLMIEMKNSEVDLKTEEIVAQAFIFFAAGFETASSSMTYCLYELARKPEVQEKARKSILDAIAKHGELEYSAINDMSYLDQCIKETLRMYPSLPVIERRALRDYVIPGTEVTIPKGMKVQLPVYAIQRDELYYPNPEEFDPDRFSQEAVALRHPCTFFPFGEGPRICIGQRFGMMQMRVGLATALSRFRFSTCDTTPIPLEYSMSSSVLQPKENVWLRVDPL